jgi:tRNA-dihydrouridine synthase 1
MSEFHALSHTLMIIRSVTQAPAANPDFLPDMPTAWWRHVLHSPTRVLAPMVDQSELAWRLLARRHGAQLVYSPMLNARSCVVHRGYLSTHFDTCSGDGPMLAQLAGDDPIVMLQAARLVADRCDGVDINLGCPQLVARKGHYGAWLQDDWPLIQRLVGTLVAGLNVPVTAKIRVFPNDEAKTVAYASMLAASGVSMLAVHGRGRDQRGLHTGLANWHLIAAIQRALPDLPIVANGNVRWAADVPQCLAATGANAVMSAEGHLSNPAIFAAEGSPHFHLPPLVPDVVDEYLTIVTDLLPSHITPVSSVRAHLFRLFHAVLHQYPAYQVQLGDARTLSHLRTIADDLNREVRCDIASADASHGTHAHEFDHAPTLPYWRCQPRVRTIAAPIVTNDCTPR